MHESVMKWFRDQSLKFAWMGKEVLEIGSLNVNGTVRVLFNGTKRYVGIDIQPGKDVDVVMSSHKLEFPDESFDVVICSEMLEHDSAPWKTMPESGRVLKSGGILFITARGTGFPYHEFPKDYWRFQQDGVKVLIAMAGCDLVEIMDDPQAPGVFGVGRKPLQTT